LKLSSEDIPRQGSEEEEAKALFKMHQKSHSFRELREEIEKENEQQRKKDDEKERKQKAEKKGKEKWKKKGKDSDVILVGEKRPFSEYAFKAERKKAKLSNKPVKTSFGASLSSVVSKGKTKHKTKAKESGGSFLVSGYMCSYFYFIFFFFFFFFVLLV